MNAFLTSINLPAVHENTLKAREKEIRPALEKIAKRSCKNAIEKEKSQWLEDILSKESPEKVGTGASYDTGWQKRGKGHNSFTGTNYNFGIIMIKENINVVRESVSLATNLPLCVVLFYFRLVFSTLRSNITYDLHNDARRVKFLVVKEKFINKNLFLCLGKESQLDCWLLKETNLMSSQAL